MADLPLLHGVAIDGYLTVTDQDAIGMARRLASEEGVFAGFSSGAVVACAARLLASTEAGASIAVVLADSGLKYLTTELWD